MYPTTIPTCAPALAGGVGRRRRHIPSSSTRMSRRRPGWSRLGVCTLSSTRMAPRPSAWSHDDAAHPHGPGAPRPAPPRAAGGARHSAGLHFFKNASWHHWLQQGGALPPTPQRRCGRRTAAAASFAPRSHHSRPAQARSPPLPRPGPAASAEVRVRSFDESYKQILFPSTRARWYEQILAPN
jgi:hypothetical protein